MRPFHWITKVGIVIMLLCIALPISAFDWYTPKYTVTVKTEGSGMGKVYMQGSFVYNDDTQDKGTENAEKNADLTAPSGNQTISLQNSKYSSGWSKPGVNLQTVNMTIEAYPGTKFVSYNAPYGTHLNITNGVQLTLPGSKHQTSSSDKNSLPELNKNISSVIEITFGLRTYYYTTPSAQATEGGTICSTATYDRPADGATGTWVKTIAQGTTSLSQNADENGKVGHATIRIYYHAKPENGYTFIGWYNLNNEELSKSPDYEHQMLATSEDSATPTTPTTIKAVFVLDNGVPEITYQEVAAVELYTGTETPGSFPYHKDGIRKIDLSAIFGTDDNKPLFDYLYIFGVTTNQDGGKEINNTLASLTTPCNALTPLYIYHSDGEKYILKEFYNAATKRFDYDATSIGNGKKFYFTGYCPFANIGRTVDDEGWMYFEGNQSSPVDIYLEDCQIYGRFRSSDGSQDTGKYPYNEVLIAAEIDKALKGEENINHMKGFSSIFVFHSTATNSGTPYKPTIHIRGNNHLKGQLGYINEVFAYVLGQKIGMEQITGTPLRSIGTSSAPITIKSSSTNGYTHLTLDDFWPTSSTTRKPTNGYLKLDTYTLGEASRVPSIDMGSEFSSITFNGGQYNLHNSAAPDGEYTCNMAISHRKFYKSAEVLGMEVKVSLYGFGGDKTTNQVIINSGTFTMEKNMYGDLGGSYYIDQNDYLDLRLPAGGGKSQINGGTFNGISNVVFCSEVASSGGSPVNGAGEWLCLQDVPVRAETTSYASATFDIPEPFDLYDSPLPVVYNLDENIESVSSASRYGGQSVNAYTKNNQRVVSLLLSGGGAECESKDCGNCEKIEEALYRNWATTIPRFAVKMAGVDTEIGGNAEVPYKKEEGESALDVKVSQLLYMDLEGLQNTKVELGDTEAQIADPDKARGNFTNEKPYTILKHLNLLKAVQADRWYTFVAPFNIHKVEVLELDEDKIKEKKTRTEAMQAQINATAKFLMDNNGLFLPNTEGRSSGMTLEEIVILSPEIQKKELISLYHYNGLKVADNNYGKNILEANYYLYEVPDANFDKETTLSGQDTFKIAWNPVSRPEGEPLMYKGKVYAMQFPFCPMCENVTVNDYWSNKLIRFYGAGDGKTGQTVNGTAYQETILSTSSTMPGAIFTGNATLSDMTLADPIAYVHNTTNDYFELNPASYVVKPTEGFLLYTPEAGAQMPTRISRTGQIEYDENAETGIDGVPTVGDRTSLMLFGAYDGFEVLALHEQLVTVYNLQGNIIFQQYMTAGEQVYVPTGAGIYVVRGESEAIKVMIE